MKFSLSNRKPCKIKGTPNLGHIYIDVELDHEPLAQLIVEMRFIDGGTLVFKIPGEPVDSPLYNGCMAYLDKLRTVANLLR